MTTPASSSNVSPGIWLATYSAASGRLRPHSDVRKHPYSKLRADFCCHEAVREGPGATTSAYGTKRTWRSRSAMSAFGGKADMPLTYCDVRF